MTQDLQQLLEQQQAINAALLAKLSGDQAPAVTMPPTIPSLGSEFDENKRLADIRFPGGIQTPESFKAWQLEHKRIMSARSKRLGNRGRCSIPRLDCRV